MKSILPLLLILGVTLTFSCKNSSKNTVFQPKTEDFNTIAINAEYQISIPRIMVGTTGLNDEASLQYQNLNEELYTIIINEPKDEFIEILKELEEYNDGLSPIQNYRDIQLRLLGNTLSINNQSSSKSLIINGLNSESMSLDANVTDVEEEISYFLTFIEGTDQAYMIMSWTLKKNKERHKKTFKTIAESFELID